MLPGAGREHTGDGPEHVHAQKYDHLPHEQYQKTAGHGACNFCGTPAVPDCVLHTQHAGVNGFQRKLKNFLPPVDFICVIVYNKNNQGSL